jgi:hypothetical protein
VGQSNSDVRCLAAERLKEYVRKCFNWYCARPFWVACRKNSQDIRLAPQQVPNYSAVNE